MAWGCRLQRCKYLRYSIGSHTWPADLVVERSSQHEKAEPVRQKVASNTMVCVCTRTCLHWCVCAYCMHVFVCACGMCACVCACCVYET